MKPEDNNPAAREQNHAASPLEHADRPQRGAPPAAVAGNARFVDQPRVPATGAPRPDAAHDAAGGKASPAIPGPAAPPASIDAPHKTYVRLTVHSDHGTLSITDAHEVDGPLTHDDTVTHGLAYEVRAAGHRIAVGSMPDASAHRAFANIGMQPRERHFADSEVFDFHVRVRAEDFTMAKLPQLELTLVHVEDSSHAVLTAEPLHVQPTLKLRELGRLTGLLPTHLPTRVRSALRP